MKMEEKERDNSDILQRIDINRSKYYKQKILKRLIGILSLITPLPFFCFKAGSLPDAYFVALFILIANGIYFLTQIETQKESGFFKSIQIDKRYTIFATVLTVLFLMMLSSTQLITGFTIAISAVNNRLLKLALLCDAILFYICLIIADYFLNIRAIQKALCPKRKISGINKTKLVCQIIITVVSLLCILSTYPGAYMQDDVTKVWYDVSTNHFDDWHTIGFELFVYLGYLLFKTPYAVIVLQTIIGIWVNWKIISYIDRKDSTHRGIIFYTVVSCLIFTPYAYYQIMMKDIIYSICLVGFVLSILRLMDGENSCGVFILAFLSGEGVCLFRHAQIIVFGITAIVICIKLFREGKNEFRKWLVMVSCVVVVYVTIVPIYTYSMDSHVAKNPKYVSYTVPIGMIGAAIANGIEMDESDREVLEEVMPIEDWKRCYYEYNLDEISRPWGRIGPEKCMVLQEKIEHEGMGKRIIVMNAKLLFAHPIQYLTSFFKANNIVWEIAKPGDISTEWGLAVLPQNPDKIYYGIPWEITNGFVQSGKYIPGYRSFALRGGIYLYIIIYCIAILYIKGKKSHIVACIPILIASALLLISLPGGHTRYILPLIQNALIFFPIAYYT